MLKRTLTGLIALSIAGCSVLDVSSSSHPDADQAAHLAPPYRRIIATRIGTIIGSTEKAGIIQISGIRRVEYIKGPSWLACLKVNSYAQPKYYAIFIQDEQVADSRMAVAIDLCEQQTYDPYDWVAEGPRPATVASPAR